MHRASIAFAEQAVSGDTLPHLRELLKQLNHVPLTGPRAELRAVIIRKIREKTDD